MLLETHHHTLRGMYRTNECAWLTDSHTGGDKIKGPTYVTFVMQREVMDLVLCCVLCGEWLRLILVCLEAFSWGGQNWGTWHEVVCRAHAGHSQVDAPFFSRFMPLQSID